MPERRQTGPASTSRTGLAAKPESTGKRPAANPATATATAPSAPTATAPRTRKAGEGARRGLIGLRRKLGRVARRVKRRYRLRHARNHRVLRRLKLRTAGHRSGGRDPQRLPARGDQVHRVLRRCLRRRSGRQARVLEEGRGPTRRTGRSGPLDQGIRRERLPDGTVVQPDRSEELVRAFRAHGIGALIAIGGDGSLRIARHLLDKGVPLVGVPKTIDNDVGGTVATFGFDTAVQTATEA